MKPRAAGKLPAVLLRRPLRVIRPQDAADLYAFPRPELARLAKAGTLLARARGHHG